MQPYYHLRKEVVRLLPNKIFKTIFSIVGFLALAGGVYAALEETITISGSSFAVGNEFSTGGTGGDPIVSNSALKLLKNLTAGNSDTNLADTVAGPTFSNINNVWKDDYLIKVHNKSTNNISIVAKANYINDTDTLRDDISVSIIEWNDINNNGHVESGEEGTIYGSNTILRLRNDTFALGSIGGNQTRGFIYRFDGSLLSSANAGKSATYDFPIIGTSQ